MAPAVTALLCRTSERDMGAALGARALALEVAERCGVEARLIGSFSQRPAAGFVDDLRHSRGCLLEAGGQVDDALAAGLSPALFAGDCSIAITTLPTVVRARPDALVLWLDAHADFNTPDTTRSKYLGGMCLAAACGLWEPDGLTEGLPRVDPASVVMCGVRDVDGGEQVLLETRGVRRVTSPSRLAGVLAGREVFVHLDLDVLDPTVLPDVSFPVDGGLSDAGLHTLLAEVAEACELVGCEVTNLGAPEHAELIASVIAPLVGV